MLPLQHVDCPPFDEALKKQSIMKTNEGFYLTWIDWKDVPADQVEPLKKQLEEAKAQGQIPPGTEPRPFIILGKCPFCMVEVVRHDA